MMGKKTRKILDTVEKILKQQEKMIRATQEEKSQQPDPELQMIHSQMMEQSRQMEQLTKAVSQHDLALTDLIDSWEEIQEAQQQKMDQLREERDAALEVELKRTMSREQNLLALQVETLDHFFLLEKVMEKMPSWREQMAMIRQQLKTKQQIAGLNMISQTEIPVNYDIHEVAEVRETAELRRDGTVAEVYRPGYLYQGGVVRKAKIAAWRYRHESEGGLDQ